jgi:hypothetical protein
MVARPLVGWGEIGRLGWLRCVLALHVRGAGRARDLCERIADPRVNLNIVSAGGRAFNLRDPVVGGFAEPVERRRKYIWTAAAEGTR